jgi:hypothetical protein
LASTAAGVAALSQVPGANSIMSLLQSGQGLVREIQGAAQILNLAKSLPGIGPLLKDVPGSKEVLAAFDNLGTEVGSLFGIQGDIPVETDFIAFTDFDAASLLEGSDLVIEGAVEYADEALEIFASFW